MQLIGMLDSPFVRRVAITCRMLDVPYEHRAVSVFRQFEAFRAINPLVKAPTLVCDDGTVLMDSHVLVAHVERLAGRSLVPADPALALRTDRCVGVAMTACEKTAQIVYERMRPADKQHAPWVERVQSQLVAAYDALDAIAQAHRPWLAGDAPSRADVDAAVAWRFTQHYLSDVIDAAHYAALADLSARAERLPAFVATAFA